MKKSSTVQLVFLNTVVLGLVGCESPPPRVDPCDTQTFNASACQAAITNRGYHYHGTWVPMVYPNPYAVYYGGYTRALAAGTPVYSPPASAYAASYRSVETRAEQMVRTVTPRNTYLSPTRMSRLLSRPASISGSRTGATLSRGGFGRIGSGRSSFGG